MAGEEKMKIVYAYVCADIIHSGHILYLKNSKALGDKLIVGVLTDKAVMEKKPKPLISFEERLNIVQSLKCVDCVVGQDEYSPVRNIKTINPDIIMESESHKGNEYLKELDESKVILLPYYPNQSSTKIKKELIKNEKRHMVRK